MKDRRAIRITVALLLSVMMVLAMMPASVFAQEKVTGTVDFYSTASDEKVLTDNYYYNPAWFGKDPGQDNIRLALLSMQLTAAASDASADGLGGRFLDKLGFKNIGYEGNDDDSKVDCNYTYGTKKLEDGSTLVAVAVESFTFSSAVARKGWRQNFIVEGGTAADALGTVVDAMDAAAEHYAFTKAANNVLDDVAALGGSDGKVKYWICGLSRGGALANLLAAKLPAVLGDRNGGIFAYTFEAPSVILPGSEEQRAAFQNNYKYIHNYMCKDDLVTKVPPWGMVLYGHKHEMAMEKTDKDLRVQLVLLRSSLKVPSGYSSEEAEKLSRGVADVLEGKIPNKKFYGEDHVAVFTDLNGKQQQVTFNYQDALTDAMGSLFGPVLKETFSMENVAKYLYDALPVATHFIQGFYAEKAGNTAKADAYYWAAAEKLPGLIQKMGMDLEIDRKETFAILRLTAPIFITDQNDPDPPAFLLSKSAWVIKHFSEAKKLKNTVFSHHMDAVISRLKTLIADAAKEDDEAALAVKNSPKTVVITKGMGEAAADKMISSRRSDKDVRGAQYLPIALKQGKVTKKSVTLKWKKAKGAAAYAVYAAKSGKANRLTKIAKTKGSSYTVRKAGAKLIKGRYYKFMIVALDKNNKVVTAGQIIHAATKGSKYAANPAGVVIKAKVNAKGKKIKQYKVLKKTVIKAGKSVRIRAEVKKAKSAKIRKYIGIRFSSSNPKVAKVSAGGKITAVSKGTCRIYAVAQNGKAKAIKITVK